MMKVFNSAVRFVGMLFVGYTTVKGTVDSAHDVEILGKKSGLSGNALDYVQVRIPDKTETAACVPSVPVAPEVRAPRFD